MRTLALVLGLVLFAPAAAHAAGTVWIVDAAAGPGHSFTAIQDAVDAAADGDTLLVRTGTYLPFELDGKGLTIAADVGADVRMQGASDIVNLAANQRAVVIGLAPVPGIFTESGLRLLDNAGTVWIQDCHLSGQTANLFGPRSALLARDCAEVVLVDSTLDMRLPTFPATDGAPGADLEASNVTIHGSSITGGAGIFGGAGGFPGRRGGAGIEVDGGVVHVAGSTVTGGDGGVGGFSEPFVPCGNGGEGGPGLHLAAGNPQVLLRDTTVAGGGGGSAEPACVDGLDGDPTVVDSGTLDALPGSARTMSATAVAREGDVVAIAFGGEVGDSVWWAVAPAPSWVLNLGGFGGVFVVGGPLSVFALGPVDAQGQLALPFVVPNLPPAVTPLTLHQQGVLLDAVGDPFATGGRATLLLDGATP